MEQFLTNQFSLTWQQKCINSYNKYIDVVVKIKNQPTLLLKINDNVTKPIEDIKTNTISA